MTPLEQWLRDQRNDLKVRWIEANLVDGCPECPTSPVPPLRWHREKNYYVGHYECPGCGHLWETGWHADVIDGDFSHPPA
jgi:hypothetical protein